MLRLVLYLTIILSFPAQAQLYFIGQGGYAQLNQDAVSRNNVLPRGLSYAAGIGHRREFIEFEGIVQKMTLAGEIDHDGQKNTFIHEDTSVTGAFNFYIKRSLYVRVGYAFHRVNQKLADPVSDTSLEGAKKAYNMQENKFLDGVVYGGGFILYNGSKVDIHTQVESMNMSSAEASIWNFALGFRYYFN